MSRKTNAAKADSDDTPATDSNLRLHVVVDSEAPTEITPPVRASNEANQIVLAAASAITGCKEDQIKNFVATADFAIRQLAVQLADEWNDICKTAVKNSDGGDKAAKVGLSFALTIDHKNLNMMDTKASLAYARKFKRTAETQEDLRQVTFDLTT